MDTSFSVRFNCISLYFLNFSLHIRYLSSESGITVVRQVLLKNIFKVGVYATELILGKGIDKYFEVIKTIYTFIIYYKF